MSSEGADDVVEGGGRRSDVRGNLREIGAVQVEKGRVLGRQRHERPQYRGRRYSFIAEALPDRGPSNGWTLAYLRHSASRNLLISRASCRWESG